MQIVQVFTIICDWEAEQNDYEYDIGKIFNAKQTI